MNCGGWERSFEVSERLMPFEVSALFPVCDSLWSSAFMDPYTPPGTVSQRSPFFLSCLGHGVLSLQ